MANILQPVAVASFCVPTRIPANAAPAQAKALGRSAASPLSAATVLVAVTAPTSMSGNGAGMAPTAANQVSLHRGYQAEFQTDKAKGGDARGIPPRGRPV